MNVIHLSEMDLDYLRDLIEKGGTARIADDNGRFKISVDRGTWSPPMGLTDAEF